MPKKLISTKQPLIVLGAGKPGKNIKGLKAGYGNVKVITIPNKATVRDYAVAHASTIQNQFDRNNVEGWDDDGGSNVGITGGAADDTSGGGLDKFLGGIEKIAGGVEKYGNTANKLKEIIKKRKPSANSSAGAGVNPQTLLTGMSEAFIADIVEKYKSGASLTQWEKRIAEAALGVEDYAKDKAKQKAAEFIADHWMEITAGIILLVLLLIKSKR